MGISLSFDGSAYVGVANISTFANLELNAQISKVNTLWVVLASTTTNASTLQYAYSTNGIDWTTSSIGSFVTTNHTNTIGWNGTEYVITTSNPSTAGRNVVVSTSIAGTWTNKPTITTARLLGRPTQFGNGVFATANFYSPTGYTGGVGIASAITGQTGESRYVRVK
jgi:hypothetical protein